jgi:hypothetical protein
MPQWETTRHKEAGAKTQVKSSQADSAQRSITAGAVPEMQRFASNPAIQRALTTGRRVYWADLPRFGVDNIQVLIW